MNPVIRYAQLVLTPDLVTMQQQVTALTSKWIPHFNTRQYEGGWTVLSLRSPGGNAEQIIPDLIQSDTYQDTSLLQHCSAIQQLMTSLQCPLKSVRLLNLQSGSIIKEHRDHDLSFENGEARLHFPVFTNPQVEFYVDGQQVQMSEGECWYINAQLPHRVANYGAADRIHLVVDCVVNDWLTSIFETAKKSFASSRRDQAQLKQIIAALRLQNTEHSNKLADKLEQEMENEK
jgi:hypothetical protein